MLLSTSLSSVTTLPKVRPPVGKVGGEVGEDGKGLETLKMYVWTVESYDRLTTLSGPYERATMEMDETYLTDCVTKQKSAVHHEAVSKGGFTLYEEEEDDLAVKQNEDDPADMFAERKPWQFDPSDQTRIFLYGMTPEGHSVLLRVPYSPFFFVEVPPTWTKTHCNTYIRQLARRLGISESRVTYEAGQYKHAWGWEPDKDNAAQTATHTCLKVRVPSASMLWAAAKFTKDYKTPSRQPLKIWESRVSPTHKFCDDTNIVPSQWMQVPKGTYRVVNSRVSHAQIEIEVFGSQWKSIGPHASDEQPPVIVVSWDIEAYSHDHAFPNPSIPEDVVIGIGTTVWNTKTNDMTRVYFGLHETRMKTPEEDEKNPDAPRPTLLTFDTEEQLLMAWRDYVVLDVDPDLVVGYNVNGFDNHYIATRMQRYSPFQENGSRFFYMGRLWKQPSPLVTEIFESKAYGKRENRLFNMTGRVTMDLYVMIMREHKLKRYSLNAVSEKFLKKQKVDLPAKEMFKAWETNDPVQRGEIAIYCAMDCDLPVHLMRHLSTVPNLMGMASVTYTPATQIVKRGQQIKVYNQILWYAHRQNFVLNDDRNDPEDYQGATVIDPIPGFYREPVVTLDYASLYPSIMRDQNLCTSTLVTNKQDEGLPGATYNYIETGTHTHCFVSHIKGILPSILENLLKERKAVRREQAACEKSDPERAKMLNGKQLAIKVSANSVYGFTGAANGKYGCWRVADSTTARGRIMIQQTKERIEKEYPGAKVIYGDTDSVMVKFPIDADDPQAMEKAMAYGEKAADLITNMFGKAIVMEFEKVYKPYLLIKKKRYAGLKFEPGKAPKVDIKGLETQRRDSADFVSITLTKMLDIILYEEDVEKAQNYCISRQWDLIHGSIPLSELVLSKSINSSKELKPSMPHVAVMLNIRKRAPGSEPKSGDRVYYIIIDTGRPNDQLYKRVEDYEYVLQSNGKIKPDYTYYLDLLMSPTLSMYSTLIKEPERLFMPARLELSNMRSGMTSMTKFLTSKKDCSQSADHASDQSGQKRKFVVPERLSSIKVVGQNIAKSEEVKRQKRERIKRAPGPISIAGFLKPK